MELFAGILIGALVGSAAASLMRVRNSQGIYLHMALGMLGAVAGAIALCALVPSPLADFREEFIVWCIAGAAGSIALVTVVNVLELCLDLEAG